MSHLSDEHARVQALLNEGRITQDEADILFTALDDEDRAEGGGADVRAAPQPTAPEPPVQPLVAPPPPPHPSERSAGADTVLGAQHVQLSGFCGDLDVRVDPNLNAPSVEGNATVERTEAGGYRVHTPPSDKGGNWLTRLHRAVGNVIVRLPADVALELNITAGDGSVRGVKRLSGSFTGGDFDAVGVEHIDLSVTAGDVSIELCPTEGQQRIRATSGDVDIRLGRGSSARVTGKATSGDLELPQGFTRTGGFVGQDFEGTVGAGDAALELKLTAGDVSVRLEP